MNIQPDTEVRSIFMEYPATSRVFEHFGIDYYCDRGHRSLADACEDLLISVDEVLRQLNEQKNLTTAADHAAKFPFDPQTAPLASVIDYIVRRYHMTARQEIPRIQATGGERCADVMVLRIQRCLKWKISFTPFLKNAATISRSTRRSQKSGHKITMHW